MMRSVKRWFGLVLVCIVVAGVTGGAAAQTKFRFAHTIGLGDAQTLAAEEFAKKVAQRTGNAIQIDLFPAGQLGNDPKVMEGVKLGTIDAIGVRSRNTQKQKKQGPKRSKRQTSEGPL